jgi:hypothetical protein
MATKQSEEVEQERRRDEGLRRALAMPPLAKTKRQGNVEQALAELIQEARDVRAEIAALRQGFPLCDRGGRSDP